MYPNVPKMYPKCIHFEYIKKFNTKKYKKNYGNNLKIKKSYLLHYAHNHFFIKTLEKSLPRK